MSGEGRKKRLGTLLSLVGFVLISFHGLTSGSATAADKRLTADRVRGLVLNGSIEEAWVSRDEFVYRRQLAEGTQWRSVDAKTGRNTAAFDHPELAKALGAHFGRSSSDSFDPRRLPILRLVGDAESWQFVTGNPVQAFRLDRTTGALEVAGWDQVEGLELRPSSRSRSSNGGRPTRMWFINPTGRPVEIHWIDRSGNSRAYGTLAPGESREQGTFVGHLWVLRVDGVEWGRFEAGAGGVALAKDPDKDPNAESGAKKDSEPQSESPTVPQPAASPPKRARRNSPDGRYQAFVRDHGLWLRDLKKGEESLLEAGAPDDHFTNRYVWSDDSKYLLAVKVVPEEKNEVSWIESSPSDRVQPRVHRRQYLKPGNRIAHPRPRLFDVERKESTPLDDALFSNPWSIQRLEYWEATGEFTFLYNQRGHQVYRWLAVRPEIGDVRTLVEEVSVTFVDYPNKTYAHRFSDGDLLWMSERSGWNHLYSVDSTSGESAPITQGEWVVRGVDRIDEETGTIWFRAMGVYPEQDPYHVHFGRVHRSGSDLVWLTASDGTHDPPTISPSADRNSADASAGEYALVRYSRVDLAPVTELRRVSDGSLIAEVERATHPALADLGWRAPERFSAHGRDGKTDIWGHIFLPSNFDVNSKYPVIEQIYAGPHGQHVPKVFRPWHGARDLAELGYIVVQIDGMGTNWRSKAFHDVCWKNLADSGFPDRIAWLEAAAETRPYVDLNRVGIYGGSAGGQSALRAVLAHGEFYKAAVADCGCHDNRMDKIWWNELWMGWPIGPHYAEQSNVTQAHRLSRPLLLVVGELDYNVDPASTLQVVHALIQADKDFDLLYMPGVGHGALGTPYATRKMRAFFREHLLER